MKSIDLDNAGLWLDSKAVFDRIIIEIDHIYLSRVIAAKVDPLVCNFHILRSGSYFYNFQHLMACCIINKHIIGMVIHDHNLLPVGCVFYFVGKVGLRLYTWIDTVESADIFPGREWYEFR